jgi:tetratricopeptide (TPR) repeat protein
MQLHLALGYTLIHTMGPVERTRTVLAKSLEIAERLDDVDAQLQTLGTLWVFHFYCGECRATEPIAERFYRIAPRTGDDAVIAVAERLRGNTLHHLGHQREAESCFQRLLDHHPAPDSQRQARWFAVLLDHRALIRQMLARVLWLRGSVEQASDLARSGLEAARAMGNSNLICAVLCFAVCPVALMTGDLATAERAVAMLSETATKLSAAFWKVAADCLKGKLLVKRGAFEAGSALLRDALDTGETTGWTMFHPEFLGALAEGLAGLGQRAEALATIDRALAGANGGAERYYLPELLRIKGDLLLQGSGHGAMSAAEDCFKEALGAAREQGALFWELRSALSLARYQRDHGRRQEAWDLLAPVYGRFTEGYGAADLRAAKEFLDELLPAREPTARP